MAQMDIILTDEMLAWVTQRVAAGGFADANAYCAELINRDRTREDRFADLRAALDEGRSSGVGTRTLEQIHAENRARRNAA